MLDIPQQGQGFSRALEGYLADTLHEKLRLRTWRGTGQLPAFLARRYVYLDTRIADQPCLFMAALAGHGDTPAEIAKHVANVQRFFRGIVAYAAPGIRSNHRARLIAHGVPFAIPGNQLYIPQLAVDLREHFRSDALRRSEHLSPVAQAVLFHYVLGRNRDLTTPSTLSEALRYSPMSIGRAFSELTSLNLARITMYGREKHLVCDLAPKELIKAAHPHLRTPVRRSHYVRGKPTADALKRAGEMALSELTALAPPPFPIFAVGGDYSKAGFGSQRIQEVEYEEDADAAVETWYYDPAILSDDSLVDILSLYAQFWNDPNERIAAAAADLLERLD